MYLFYQQKKIVTLLYSQTSHQIFCIADIDLAEREGAGVGEGVMLASDQAGTVLGAAGAGSLIYNSYGFSRPRAIVLPQMRFKGERLDFSGMYLLGNGVRTYNPCLMRFCSSDEFSPFGRGGIHSYAYCGSDPINRTDPSGRTWEWIKRPLRALGMMKPPQRIRKANEILASYYEMKPNLEQLNNSRRRFNAQVREAAPMPGVPKLVVSGERPVNGPLLDATWQLQQDYAVVSGQMTNLKLSIQALPPTKSTWVVDKIYSEVQAFQKSFKEGLAAPVDLSGLNFAKRQQT